MPQPVAFGHEGSAVELGPEFHIGCTAFFLGQLDQSCLHHLDDCDVDHASRAALEKSGFVRQRIACKEFAFGRSPALDAVERAMGEREHDQYASTQYEIEAKKVRTREVEYIETVRAVATRQQKGAGERRESSCKPTQGGTADLELVERFKQQAARFPGRARSR